MSLVWFLAVRGLIREKGRFLIHVLAVAIAIALMSFWLAVQQGVLSQISTYIDHVGADLWVVQTGTRDFVSNSIVPRELEMQLARISGVEKVAGIFVLYTSVKVKDRRTAVYVIGFDPKKGLGGPWRLAGRRPVGEIGSEDIIVDQVFARKNMVALGDDITLLARKFKVVAFSQETSALGSDYLFVSRKAIEELVPSARQASTHILIQLERGAAADRVAAEIRQSWPRIDVLTQPVFAANTRDYTGAFINPLVGFGVLIGFMIGLTIIGMMLYSSTMEQIREYAVIKAIGCSNHALLGLVLTQAGVMSLFGFLCAIPLTGIILVLLNNFVPGMTARLHLPTLLSIAVLGFVMAALAGAMPAYKVARVDPVRIFRG